MNSLRLEEKILINKYLWKLLNTMEIMYELYILYLLLHL